MEPPGTPGGSQGPNEDYLGAAAAIAATAPATAINRQQAAVVQATAAILPAVPTNADSFPARVPLESRELSTGQREAQIAKTGPRMASLAPKGPQKAKKSPRRHQRLR